MQTLADEKGKFDEIVLAIRQADQLIEEGKDRQGIAQYQLAQKQLLQFQQSNPGWDEQVVAFRLKYLADKLENWNTGSSTSPNRSGSSATANDLHSKLDQLERANAQYQNQLQQLHSENSRLTTKLREALALRPAAQEPVVIAETQARLEQAELELAQARQEKDALEKELDEYPEPEEAKQNLRLLEATRKNLNQVIAEAEELRKQNEKLRRSASTRQLPARSGAETLHKEVVATQAALQLADAEIEQLRKENGNLNSRLASLEARLESSNRVTGADAAPSLSRVDNARLALAQGDHNEAAKILTARLDSAPEDPEALYLLGRTHLLQDKIAEAETCLKKALELSPESAVAHFELARLYYARDGVNPGMARWHYHKALNLGYPRDAAFEKRIRWEQPGG